MQKAVFGAIKAAAEINSAYAVRKATEARKRHRSPELCDALVRHLSGEAPPAPPVS